MVPRIIEVSFFPLGTAQDHSVNNELCPKIVENCVEQVVRLEGVSPLVNFDKDTVEIMPDI